MKKNVAIVLSILLMLSLMGCSRNKDKDSVNTNKPTSEAEVTKGDDNNKKETPDVSDKNDNSDVKDNGSDSTKDSDTKISGTGIFAVTAEKENTDLQYKKEQYKEIDAAFSIIKDYHMAGINAVSDKLVSGEYEDGKIKISPLNDKEKKDLDLEYQSMLNQITGKITEVTIDNYHWQKSLGVEPDAGIDVVFNLVIKTDKGKAYNTLGYINEYNDNGQLKIQMRP